MLCVYVVDMCNRFGIDMCKICVVVDICKICSRYVIDLEVDLEVVGLE